METSKLYSEILKEIENKSNILCEDAGKEHSVVDDFSFQELALSIEQLLLDKMEGLAEFIDKNNYSMLAGKWDSWSRNATSSDSPKTTKELIQLYLNK